MIILRQKSYSWDEIKRATKTIGGSAAIGATGGMILTGRKREKTSGKLNKKGALKGIGIGAVAGALVGAGIYRVGHKERLKAKQIKDKFEAKYGTNLENYISKNIDINQIKQVCKEIENLNNSYEKAVEKSKFDYLYLYSNVLSLRFLDYNTDDSMLYVKYGPDNIPILDFTCIYFEDVIYNGYIMYNIESKKFIISSIKSKPDTFKNNLLLALEILFDHIEYDVKENYDGEDEFNDMQEGFEFWKKEYYEKAKNIIKQVRI
jgi:hypothetical protein